ncbi:MAG: GtrA family protein [Saprospiraceae bacterium]|jgi:putative flippase GtrA|tara:strand:- start:273 stop:647 length:375 start_codon:yes stop_codon:yes gene_type:complete
MMKVKFAMSSSVATLVDYVLYQVLVRYLFSPVVSNLISATVGMVINFFLQKKYIFELKRSVNIAFIISLFVSVGGIGISTIIIHFLNKSEMLAGNQYIIKAIATGTVFFYNFYLKRFAFEKRII